MAIEDTQSSVKSSTRSEHNIGKVVLPLLILVLVMVWSAYDTGPSGQSLGVKGFVLFWLRELIILALAIIVLVGGGISWLKKRNQQRRGGSHAP